MASLSAPLDPIEESPIGPIADRSIAAAVFLAGVMFVWFLWQVVPDSRGHGTHEQFGMSKCGFVVHYGKPCPTCGVTTAGAHLVRLHVFQSIKTQPFGAALGGFGIWLAGAALWSLLRRRSYFDLLQRLPQVKILVWGTVLLLLSWLYTYLTFPPS